MSASKTLLQRALSIQELAVSLENISHDDKRPLEDYADSEILDEARYVLSTFNERGHQNNDELICEHGDKAAQREARKQVAALIELLRS